jgi:hypothetical protein
MKLLSELQQFDVLAVNPIASMAKRSRLYSLCKAAQGLCDDDTCQNAVPEA